MLACLLSLGAVACGSEDEGGSTESEGEDSSGTETVEVSAADFSFTPEAVNVAAGAEVTVTFTNEGEAPHTMTSDDLELDIAADPGESADGTFTAPDSGTVEFHCEVHPDMTGQIVVEGSEAGSGGSEDEGGEKEGDTGYDY
jgi:plastocyanin